MGDYVIKIGDQQFIKEVKGAEDFAQAVERDFNDKLLRVRGDYSLTAYQGLYEMIYGNILTNGACDALTAKVFYRGSKVDGYEETWRGEVKPQDGEFDLLNSKVDTQILDNSWMAKFNNSNSQKVFLRSTKSKNGSIIKSCDSDECQFFDPTDSVLGNYLPDRRLCFRLFDVFTFLVRYYTDDTVSFASDFLDIGGDGDQYYITTGAEIREYENGANPEVSFQEVFEEMDRKLNLWIIIEGTLDAPVLRIEQQGYAFSEDIVVEVDNPESIKMKIDLDQLYTSVNVGSSQTDFDKGNDSNYPNARFLAWNEESYNTPGGCDFENNQLDLVSTWRIDTNTIEKILIAKDDSFDDDIFLVEIDPTDPTFGAFKFTTSLTGSNTVYYIYNFNLTNQNVLQNWLGGLTEDLVKAISPNYDVYVDGPPGVLVGGLGYSFITSGGGSDPFGYQNDSVAPAKDSSDIYTLQLIGGYYSGEFKPIVNGVYHMEGDMYVNTNTGSSVGELQVAIVVYEDDTLSTIVVEYLGDSRTYPYQGILSISEDVFIPENGVARVEVKSLGSGLFYTEYAFMTFTDLDYEYTIESDPLIYIYDIQSFKLPKSEFDTLKSDITKKVRFIDTKSERSWEVWPKNMEYNQETQMVKVGEFIGRKPSAANQCYVLEGGIWNDACYWQDDELWID